RELLVESTHHLFVLVLQLTSDEFACFSFQITDRLLSCMKVNADIYWVHSASFQSHVLSDCVTGREFSTHGGRRCFITSVPPRGSGWVRHCQFSIADCQLAQSRDTNGKSAITRPI